MLISNVLMVDFFCVLQGDPCRFAVARQKFCGTAAGQEAQCLDFNSFSIDWSKDRVKAYFEKYCTKEGEIDPDPFDFTAFQEYAEVAPNILVAAEAATLELSHIDYQQSSQFDQDARPINTTASYQAVD